MGKVKLSLRKTQNRFHAQGWKEAHLVELAPGVRWFAECASEWEMHVSQQSQRHLLVALVPGLLPL